MIKLAVCPCGHILTELSSDDGGGGEQIIIIMISAVQVLFRIVCVCQG